MPEWAPRRAWSDSTTRGGLLLFVAGILSWLWWAAEVWHTAEFILQKLGVLRRSLPTDVHVMLSLVYLLPVIATFGGIAAIIYSTRRQPSSQSLTEPRPGTIPATDLRLSGPQRVSKLLQLGSLTGATRRRMLLWWLRRLPPLRAAQQAAAELRKLRARHSLLLPDSDSDRLLNECGVFAESVWTNLERSRKPNIQPEEAADWREAAMRAHKQFSECKRNLRDRLRPIRLNAAPEQMVSARGIDELLGELERALGELFRR